MPRNVTVSGHSITSCGALISCLICASSGSVYVAENARTLQASQSAHKVGSQAAPADERTCLRAGSAPYTNAMSSTKPPASNVSASSKTCDGGVTAGTDQARRARRTRSRMWSVRSEPA